LPLLLPEHRPGLPLLLPNAAPAGLRRPPSIRAPSPCADTRRPVSRVSTSAPGAAPSNLCARPGLPLLRPGRCAGRPPAPPAGTPATFTAAPRPRWPVDLGFKREIRWPHRAHPPPRSAASARRRRQVSRRHFLLILLRDKPPIEELHQFLEFSGGHLFTVISHWVLRAKEKAVHLQRCSDCPCALMFSSSDLFPSCKAVLQRNIRLCVPQEQAALCLGTQGHFYNLTCKFSLPYMCLSLDRLIMLNACYETVLDLFMRVQIIIFVDKVILEDPIESWPLCDCLIALYSSGYPLEKGSKAQK
ncbi:hypothetical protein U9M48_011387, partial [Paspalum notatum var. saurae]